jgi:hypothetical protein
MSQKKLGISVKLVYRNEDRYFANDIFGGRREEG